MKRTIAEIAQVLEVSEEAARGLVVFLRETGLVRFRGERTPERGSGKGPHVYTVEAGSGDTVRRMIGRLE